MPVFTAIGKVKSNTYFTIVQFILIGIVLYVGYILKVNIVMYSWLFVITSSVFYLLKSYISVRYLKIPIKKIYHNLEQAFLFSMCSLLIYFLIVEFLSLSKIIACLVFIVLSLAIILKESKQDVLKILKRQ